MCLLLRFKLQEYNITAFYQINTVMIFGFLTLFISLAIAGVAAWFSIEGLMAIFSASALEIAIMAGTLEVGKLLTASWLYRYWNTAGLFIKSYLTVAVLVLMLITSMGIFGYLSKAHLDQAGVSSDAIAAVERLDGQISREENKISILETNKVSNEFHSRFSAKGRKYKYCILNRRTASPLLRNKSWRIPNHLDLKLMENASKYLIGKHDFTAFRSIDCQAKSPIKTIDNITINNEGELIEIYVEAKSFLMNQVRIIAGTLVDIGLLKKTNKDIQSALDNKDRKFSGPTAPSCALILQKIIY